jgi:hypothetical protein
LRTREKKIDHGAGRLAAANADAANGVNTVAECYVAGISPMRATQVFRTVISWEDGEARISWEPDLNDGGAKSERVYTVEGKEALTDDYWTPTNSASRFIHVKVALPE